MLSLGVILVFLAPVRCDLHINLYSYRITHTKGLNLPHFSVKESERNNFFTFMNASIILLTNSETRCFSFEF